MNLFNLNKNQKPKRYLVIDIRSSSVSVAIVNLAKKDPEIEFVSKKSLHSLNPSSENIDKFISDMVNLVDKTLEEVISVGLPKLSIGKKNNIKINDILVTYGSPWNKVFTKDIKIKKEKPFIFTKKKFDEIIEQQIKSEGKDLTTNKIVEKDVTHVILNGYELSNPFDKEAKEITISFYLSFISKKIIEAIETKIDSHFHKAKIINRTFPLILFTSIRDTFMNAHTFTFFDISGEVTDFGVINQGSFVYIGSIPIGKNHIIREVSRVCNIENSVASSILSLIAKGEADESCTKDISSVLEKIEQDWINGIKKLLNENKIHVPKMSFLTADEDGLEFFSKVLNKSFAKRNLFETEQDIQVIILGRDKLNNFINKKEDTKPNPHLILSSIFLKNNY